MVVPDRIDDNDVEEEAHMYEELCDMSIPIFQTHFSWTSAYCKL